MIISQTFFSVGEKEKQSSPKECEQTGFWNGTEKKIWCQPRLPAESCFLELEYERHPKGLYAKGLLVSLVVVESGGGAFKRGSLSLSLEIWPWRRPRDSRTFHDSLSHFSFFPSPFPFLFVPSFLFVLCALCFACTYVWLSCEGVCVRVSNPLVLEVEIFVSCHVDAGYWTQTIYCLGEKSVSY